MTSATRELVRILQDPICPRAVKQQAIDRVSNDAPVIICDVDLSGSTLSGLSFQNCTFVRTVFASATCDGTVFATLDKCRFYDSSALGSAFGMTRDCSFHRSCIDTSRFLVGVERCDFESVCMRRATIGKTSARIDNDICSSRFALCDMFGINAVDACLSCCTFDRSNLSYARFCRADLSASELRQVIIDEANCIGAIVHNMCMIDPVLRHPGAFMRVTKGSPLASSASAGIVQEHERAPDQYCRALSDAIDQIDDIDVSWTAQHPALVTQERGIIWKNGISTLADGAGRMSVAGHQLAVYPEYQSWMTRFEWLSADFAGWQLSPGSIECHSYADTHRIISHDLITAALAELF